MEMSVLTLYNVNQFKPTAFEKIKNEIENIDGELLGPTVSLCHHCHYHIPAFRYVKENKVYICKHCQLHGAMHHQIESDYEFYKSLYKSKELWNWDGHVLIEASDRCNLECPHCYHLPDNKMKDVDMQQLLNQIENWPGEVNTVMLAGAEASLRKDFVELSNKITEMGLNVSVLTNGIKFADAEFVEALKDSNMIVTVGLNHPDYIGNATVRDKQIKGIEYSLEHLSMGYIGYTLVSFAELDFVLNEILNSGWNPSHFRVRCGSEIGRNATTDQIFVSDLYKEIEKWANNNDKSFSREYNADNNIYHVVVKLDGRLIRVIQWCDETNIDMEELRTGPWCDFVPDGITNFLHQVIRRDIWKNNGITLPDTPPLRYQLGNQNMPPLTDTFEGIL
jgi:organic radical activating enzyme